MKTKALILLLLAQLPFASAQQPQWKLQPFMEYFGHVRGTGLGIRVKGFIGSQPNNPYNVAVAGRPSGSDLLDLRFYSISSPTDTTPRWIIPQAADVVHGDFNGDELTDFAVWKSVTFNRYADTVFVYLGNAAGIDTIPALKLLEEKQQTGFGFRMCAGDINNDQIDDLVITAPGYYISNGNNGKVYVYFGKPQLQTVADITITGDNPEAGLGSRCAIGDFNDDGFNDLAIRGLYQSGMGFSFGYLNIYLGSAEFDTIPDLIGNKSGTGVDGLAAFDVNGDQRTDLLWTFIDSLSFKHSVFIHFGGSDFQSRFQITPDFVIHAPMGSIDFGNEIGDAGDMNGDGNKDLIVAASSTGQGNGIVFVYTCGNAIDELFDAARGQALEGTFGASVGSVGDVNHDGYHDIVVGAPSQPWHRDEGYFGIFLGDYRIPTQVNPKNQKLQPSSFILHPGYPNPFNHQTIFSFSLPRRAAIELKIYNLLGKEVRDLLYHEYASGQYEVLWNGKNNKRESVPTGIYLVRMRAFASERTVPVFEQIQKFTIVR